MIFLFLGVFSAASSSANEAFDIVKKIEQASRGKIGVLRETKMILINSSGHRVERLMISQMIERPEGEDRSLITFIVPKDIKGTKMLTWKRKGIKDNDQWLYLPSLRRVKRIQGPPTLL